MLVITYVMCVASPSSGSVETTGTADVPIVYTGSRPSEASYTIDKEAAPAHVAFVIIPERGHIGAVLGLATELATRGHRITFASIGAVHHAHTSS